MGRKTRARHSMGGRHGEQFWEDEKQNFGLKYMNKFGWTQGDGLGKQKQGTQSHVKTKYKNDNKGIGHKQHANNEMFQATMFMFNDILSGLQGKKKKIDESTPASKNLSASAVIKSYEAKHHLYGKFRAAKNISARSEEEKNQLFGIDNRQRVGFTEDDQTNYALQMNAISMSRSGHMGLGFGASDDNGMQNKQLTFGKFMRSGVITRDDLLKPVEEKKEKKSKKKKKKKKKVKEMEDLNIVINDGIDVEKKSKSKKKKKSKKRKLEKGVDNEQPVKKRKLKKEDNASDISSSELILSRNPTPVQSDSEIIDLKKKKSKKKKD